MIYTTGTIAISRNNVTGTGTNFTAAGSLIRNGCTVIAMTSPAQVFQITAIGSATSLTVTPAANPDIPAGTKYAILLSDSLSVDGLAQDIAETFTMYQRYMSGFADVMNGTTDVTITINGAAVTVPGQKSLARKGANSDITSLSGLTTALSVAQGGTGSTTASGARTNLGLGTAATKDTGTAPGQVLLAGAAFGLGSNLDGYSYSQPTGFYTGQPDSPTPDYGGGCIRMSHGGYQSELYSPLAGKVRLFARNINTSTGGSAWAEYYSTANTTKASDGTLKAASPVARIIKSQEENQRSDIVDDGFLWCGCGAANAEAEGITISRLDVGVYVLTGSAGLASDGWQLLPPMDPGGIGELGVVEAVKTDNGELTIRLFKRKYMLGDEGEIVKTKGEPIDVPANSWIDVRLDMPENSVWNQRQKEAMAKETQEPAS